MGIVLLLIAIFFAWLALQCFIAAIMIARGYEYDERMGWEKPSPWLKEQRRKAREDRANFCKFISEQARHEPYIKKGRYIERD